VADPKLLSLANNGGPTQTMALADDSPAIGAGDSKACNADPVNGMDQRHVTRKSDDQTCDIGAFQIGTPVPPATQTTS
jgi:hypothetical protein